MLNERGQSHLHCGRHRFEPTDAEELAVGCLHAQVHVFAGEDDLQEVLVVQEASLVCVEEVDQLLAVLLGELDDSIVPQKIENILAVEVFFGCSVDPHKCAVGTEVRVSNAEALPQLLRGDLAFHHFN